MENFGNGTCQKILKKHLTNRTIYDIIIYSESEVIQMERVYDLVKCWYDRDAIDDQEWQEFCTAMLEALMEDNKEVLKRLKNI